MSKNRQIIFLRFSIICVLLILARIFYLQVFSGRPLLKAASAQMTTYSQIDISRGNILDRNGIPFTNRRKKISLAIQPLTLKGNPVGVKKLCNILGLDYPTFKREIETKKESILICIDESTKKRLMDIHINGISFIHSLERYNDTAIARHLTGYLNKVDQTGQAGIEKAYDEILRRNKKEAVSVVTDAKNNLLLGLGYRIIKSGKSSEDFNVKLTIDYHIQKITEEVLNENKITGAVVVEDVTNGDILAMVSKPDFNQNEIEKHLASPKNDLFNRAVASYSLGSVFKIVDTALIFERGLNNTDSFYCPGYIKVGEKIFKCSSIGSGGHGFIGLDQAFMHSCNPYFIDTGIKIGSKSIIEMAYKFGLGKPIGIKNQGIDETSGILPSTDKYFTHGDVANISIGQGDILATPVQVANLVAIVANGGIKNSVNIVDCISDNEGNKIKGIRQKNEDRVISAYTADKLKELMEMVTTKGTGTKANLEGFGGAGGKTGSAETGQIDENGKVIHAWFAGYFPKDNPRYSIAVFVENGKNGGRTATPIFAEIAKRMLKKGY